MLRCVCVYHRSTDTHEAGGELSLASAPRYRVALEEHRGIVAHDARSDPRTSELTAEYLGAHGIVSMLDAPLFQHGEVVGVVCHEHTGAPRRWTDAEVAFAESVADLVALTMEQSAHIEARRSLEELSTRAEADRRMAAFGRVAAGVAHDFANLLMIVRARADQIATHDRVAPRWRMGDGHPRRRAPRARSVHQLAEIGRGREPVADTSPLDEIVRGAAGLLEALAPRGAAPRLALDAPEARVRLDRFGLERFSSTSCRTRSTPVRPGRPCGSPPRRPTVSTVAIAVLRVVDQGHGIDDETRPTSSSPIHDPARLERVRVGSRHRARPGARGGWLRRGRERAGPRHDGGGYLPVAADRAAR